MKIAYEPGDIVKVEDDIRAGQFAATTVQLIKKLRDNKWLVEDMQSFQEKKGMADEKWFHPH